MKDAQVWPFMPEVKRVQSKAGAYYIPTEGLAIIYTGGAAKQAAQWIAEQLEKHLGINVSYSGNEGILENSLRICSIGNGYKDSAQNRPQIRNVSEHEEGYACYVREDEMEITAHTYRGFLYGWFSLEQWMNEKVFNEGGQIGIPAVEFADWPELNMRGQHLDFKGSVPHMSYVIETINRLARLKINTLLIEYENQFPYKSLPQAHKKDGYTAEEIAEMLDCAKSLGMEVIPFVQCLGHVDYVLKHEEYAHLREDGVTFQYCPSHPGSLELFKQMVEELLEAHPESRYIHIGADEPVALGRCVRCQEWMTQHDSSGSSSLSRSKVDLYLNYIRQAANYVIGKGLVPMIWDDLFHSEKSVERMKELPANTVICSWSYYDFGQSNWIWWNGMYYASKLWLERDPGAVPQMNWLEDLPMDEQERMRACWDQGEYPLYGSGHIPWVKEYREQGFEVVGASCVRGADHTNTWFAPQGERVDNAAFWPAFALESGMKGVIASAWTRFYSLSPPIEPWETGWYPQAAHACYAWSACTSREDFNNSWTAKFAEGNPLVLKAIHWMDQGASSGKSQYYYAAKKLLSECKLQSPKLQRYITFLLVSAWQAELSIQLETALREVEWVLYGKEARENAKNDVIVQRGILALEARLKEAEDWENKAMDICREWMASTEAEELVEHKFYAFKMRANVVLSAISPSIRLTGSS